MLVQHQHVPTTTTEDTGRLYKTATHCVFVTEDQEIENRDLKKLCFNIIVFRVLMGFSINLKINSISNFKIDL